LRVKLFQQRDHDAARGVQGALEFSDGERLRQRLEDA
jgi:hypothetical protein